MRRRTALAASLSFALAACGGPQEEPAVEGETAVEAEAPDARSDAEGPVLEALGNEISTDLGPTLGGCSFEHAGDILLIAGADDDVSATGKGVVKLGGGEILLEADQAGGPASIDAGPTMVGEGVMASVERADGDGEPVGVESVQWPAELVVRDEEGGETLYAPGTWTCGV